MLKRLYCQYVVDNRQLIFYNAFMSIESILSLVGVTGSPQRVLLELLTSGPQTATFLAKKLSLPRPSVYDALHLLEEKSLIVSQEESGKSIFSISNPDVISQLINSSKEKLEVAQSEFDQIKPDLLKSPRITEPKIRVFSGREGCQQIMRDILWLENITTYTLWPVSDMLEFLTPEFMEWHNKRRIERNITLHAIRRVSDEKIIERYQFMAAGENNLREAKLLDLKFSDFKMSYWIYGDNVAFVSAGKEFYGFIVHSKEFVEMMQFHFNLLWETSR